MEDTLGRSVIYHRANTEANNILHSQSHLVDLNCMSLDCRKKPMQVHGEHGNAIEMNVFTVNLFIKGAEYYNI